MKTKHKENPAKLPKSVYVVMGITDGEDLLCEDVGAFIDKTEAEAYCDEQNEGMMLSFYDLRWRYHRYYVEKLDLK